MSNIQSNEHLAILAQQGDKNAMFELWEQTRLLIYKLMVKYFPMCSRFGMEQDDLKQCGYFALVRAVKAYKPEGSAVFVSYLGYHVQNVVQEAFGRRGKKDPPPLIVSLDEPVKGVEDGGITIGDSIPDETASAEFERIQNDWQRKQLAVVMEKCLAELPEQHREILHARYYQNQTLKEVGAAQGCAPEYCRQQQNRALRTLRNPRFSKRLKPYYDALDFVRSRAHTAVSLAAFKHRGASQPEWIVEVLEKYGY